MMRTDRLLSALIFGLVAQAEGMVQFTFPVTGLQEVPPNQCGLAGTGDLILAGQRLSGFIRFPYDGFPWSARASIRGPAGIGKTGPIIFDLGPVGGSVPYPPWDPGSCFWYVDLVLTTEQVAQISSGLWYVEATSNESPNGFVRGQILPSTPVITRQPVGGDVIIGYSLTLTADIIGSPTPSLQWQCNGSNILNATSTNYTLQATSTNETGVYALAAWNSYGTNVSNGAYVKVWPAGSVLLRGWLYSNGAFVFQQSDVSSDNYVVQAATNVAATNWLSLQTNQAPFVFTDTLATNYPLRFYRTLLLRP